MNQTLNNTIKDTVNTTLNATLNATTELIKKKEDSSIVLIIIAFLLLLRMAKYTDSSSGDKFIVYDEKTKKTKKKDPTALNKVIGLESVKKEIKYYMDFINHKEKYTKWNVKLPKGILLAGPPGTGKTLLVKTISKQLQIPLIICSGSQFIEKYVGVGAQRVRALFAKAKTYEKCIIFIDEIDAVGRKRGFDNNSERDSTVNQLLVEMDGFDETTNLIVFAATNLVKTLDSALTRSGRFDKKIYFDLPNIEERTLMHKLYFKNMILPSNMCFKNLAERTAGLSGADIANIANQSKINAIQNKNNINNITENDIQTAIDEVMIGREKRERILSLKERERVSHHEAGHCIMGYILKHVSHPVKVSIIPRGEAALGFSQQKPNNKLLMTREEVLCKISVLLGGRCAEKIIYDNVSTGASDDIEKISTLIHHYTMHWGMNDSLGPLNPNVMGALVDTLDHKIMEQCNQIVKHIESQTMKYLTKHKSYIKEIATSLLKNETILYSEIKNILPDTLEDSSEILCL